jgi:hypothetical protein
LVRCGCTGCLFTGNCPSSWMTMRLDTRRKLCKFSEGLIDLVRGITRGNYLREIVKFWYRILCLDVEDPAKQWLMAEEDWAVEMKEELCNIGWACMWTKGQECNWKETTEVEKRRCYYIKRQNIFDTIVTEKLINTVPRNEPLMG